MALVAVGGRNSGRPGHRPPGKWSLHLPGVAGLKSFPRSESDPRHPSSRLCSLENLALCTDLFDCGTTTMPTPAGAAQRERQAVGAKHLAHKVVVAVDIVVNVYPQEQVRREARILGNGLNIGGEAAKSPDGEILRIPLRELVQGALDLASKEVVDTGGVDAVLPSSDLPHAALEEEVGGLAGLADEELATLNGPWWMAFALCPELFVDIDPVHTRGTHREEVGMGHARRPTILHDDALLVGPPTDADDQVSPWLLALLLTPLDLDKDIVLGRAVAEVEDAATMGASLREGDHSGEGKLGAESAGEAHLAQVEALAPVKVPALARGNGFGGPELHEDDATRSQLRGRRLELLENDPVLCQEAAAYGDVSVEVGRRLHEEIHTFLHDELLYGLTNLGVLRPIRGAILGAALAQCANRAIGPAFQLEGERHLPA
mmetsp:Transcript_125884/g.268559  ORF Transcript_125884/g.268559 Transcript_125884/m.268559 type:complete len:432 (+) Transcript_125884:167-1462(+)